MSHANLANEIALSTHECHSSTLPTVIIHLPGFKGLEK